jgi:hypothetical protein
MNFKRIHMKTRHLLLLAFSALLLPATLNAQTSTDSVFWDNGNVSLLSDLAPVLIILKKGNDLKDVRIKEIKKERGILVYEKEKCLHDVYINNIKRIQAGKYTTHPMFFYADNTPYIKMDYAKFDPLMDFQEFKSVKMPVQVFNETKPVAVVVAEPLTQENPPTTTSSVCDTIIEPSGRIILAKIVEIEPALISYKKITNPNGPIYVKANNNATITRYNNCISIHLK